MGNTPLSAAIKHVVDDDGMTQAYGDRLTALIQNAMRANIDDSDIEALLDTIEVEEPPDED